MDKETLSNYGWIVIAVLVLAIMIALATPFGSFVSGAVKSTTQGLFDTNKNALNGTGLINIADQSFEDGGSDFYTKPDDSFAIMNYYEIMTSCPHYDDKGGFTNYCLKIYHDYGYSELNPQKWSENIEFLKEHLYTEMTEHVHTNVFAFEYKYAEGMTWNDFINSEANNGRFAIGEEGCIYYVADGVNYGHKVATNNSTEIQSTDIIDKDMFYFIGYTEI